MLRLHSNLGRLASLDNLRAGLGDSLITQHHHWSTTANGYGQRSESGRQGRTERTARIGAVTAGAYKRSYPATPVKINGHHERAAGEKSSAVSVFEYAGACRGL